MGRTFRKIASVPPEHRPRKPRTLKDYDRNDWRDLEQHWNGYIRECIECGVKVPGWLPRRNEPCICHICAGEGE